MSKPGHDDFYWVTNPEPHKQRRKEMLEKYPQIQELYGYDPNSKYKVFLCHALQLLTCYLISECSWPVIVLVAYVWGGTINHSLMLAVHELSHELFFSCSLAKYLVWNFLLIAFIITHFLRF